LIASVNACGEDGDFLDLDWHGPHSVDAPLVLVLHGLTGSSNSPYVAGIQQALGDRAGPASH
jgi:predicted alpha/beta-fold hydrolase